MAVRRCRMAVFAGRASAVCPLRLCRCRTACSAAAGDSAGFCGGATLTPSAASPQDGNVVTYPAGKDDTDRPLAARYAVAQGCRELVFYGALGGRLDHTIANLQMLRLLADADTAGILIDAGHRVTLQRGGMWNSRQVYRKPQTGKWYLSLVCHDTGLPGNHISRRCLSSGTRKLPRASNPLGVSNEILGEQAEISVEKGDLLVVAGKKRLRIRSRLHKKYMWIFEHNFVADKAKIRRRAVARQVFFHAVCSKICRNRRHAIRL